MDDMDANNDIGDNVLYDYEISFKKIIQYSNKELVWMIEYSSLCMFVRGGGRNFF